MDNYDEMVVRLLAEMGEREALAKAGMTRLFVLCEVPVWDDGILAPTLAMNEDQASSQIEEMMKQKLVHCDDGTIIRDDGRKFVWMYNLKKWLDKNQRR